MPDTTQGITYPDSSGSVRIWEHLEALAEDVDLLVRVPKVDVFTASGTWTKPAGAHKIMVELVGGGGAGGGSTATSTGQYGFGDGGGGGEYARGWLDPGSVTGTVAVTVGAGGTGTSAAGNTGGTSSFGAYMTAIGGGGGSTRPNNASAPQWSQNRGVRTGGSGGTGGSNAVRVFGGCGGAGFSISVTAFTGGDGGASALGGGTPYNAPGGDAGRIYGGGGTGAGIGASTAARNGGAGAAGLVVVTTYFQGAN